MATGTFFGVKFLILSRSRFVGTRNVLLLTLTDLGAVNFGFAGAVEAVRLPLRVVLETLESGDDPQQPTPLHWCECGILLFNVFAMMKED